MEPSEDYSLLNEEINDGDVGVKNNSQPQDSANCKVYKRRWYVLFVLVLTSIVSNIMWNTWGPIQRPCRFVFGWERWAILLLSSFGAIGPILGAFPSTWLMDVKGLRISLLVTSSMLLVGKAIQVIPFHDIKLRTVVIFFGHLVTMLPSFVANGGPPVVSSTWFPPNERTTATAIGSLAANFGAALAFIIGPYMTTGNFTNDQTGPTNNATKQDVEKSIMNYFYVETGLAAFLFTCVVSYLPDKPPTPPSVATFTRTTTKISYIDGGRMLLRNGPFWLLAVGFAFSFGIYFGWTSVLDLAVEPFGVSKTMSGWLGTGTSLAGIISGVVIARSADVLKRWTKTILLCLYIGTVTMQLLFALSCSQILPSIRWLLLVSVICSGLFFNGTVPLLFELIMECVFPVGEGTSVGVGLLLGNAVMLVFDVIFMFPMSDFRWMNWVCAGGVAVCIPLIGLSKTAYQRLNLEKNLIPNHYGHLTGARR